MNNEGPSSAIAKSSIAFGGKENGNRYVSAGFWLIALTPLLHLIATIDFDGTLSPSAYALRHLSIPVILIEIAIIFVAMQAGFSLAKSTRPDSKLFKWLLGIWASCAVLSGVLSLGDIPSSLFLLLRIAVHLLTFAAIIYLISSSHSFSADRWIAGITKGAVLYVFAICCFVIAVPEPDSFPWVFRLPSATNVRQIGIVAGLLSFMPLAAILFGKGKPHSGFVLSWFALVCFAAWTGTRTTFLGYAIGIPLALFFVKKLPEIKRLAIAGAASIAAISASIPIPVPDQGFGLIRMVNKVSDEGNLGSGRIDLWQATFERILNNPFIGHGIGYFRQDVSDSLSTSMNHPHNIVLQFIYDWGIIGGAAAIGILIMLAWTIFKRAPASPLLGFLAASSLMAVFAMSMIEGPLYHPLPVLILLASIAPLIAQHQRAKIDTATSQLVGKH